MNIHKLSYSQEGGPPSIVEKSRCVMSSVALHDLCNEREDH